MFVSIWRPEEGLNAMSAHDIAGFFYFSPCYRRFLEAKRDKMVTGSQIFIGLLVGWLNWIAFDYLLGLLVRLCLITY